MRVGVRVRDRRVVRAVGIEAQLAELDGDGGLEEQGVDERAGGPDAAHAAAGALLLAMNLPISGYAWLLMLVSNGAWITYALVNRIGSILFMQVIYTITSIVGIYRWLM